MPAEFFLFRNLRDLLACHAVVVLVKAGAIPAVQPSGKLGALVQGAAPPSRKRTLCFFSDELRLLHRVEVAFNLPIRHACDPVCMHDSLEGPALPRLR